MTTALPLAYAAPHIYAPNEDPYRAKSGRSTVARRRRRPSAGFLWPGRPRLALYHQRAATGR